MIAHVPFVTEADRSVALSAFVTACSRNAFPTSPLHAFTAPVRGSGKAMLADVASMMATGRPASVMAQTPDEAEMEKRLGGALLQGAQIVAIDDCTVPLDGVLLNALLAQTIVRIRPLGGSKIVDLPSHCLVTAGGNNLVIAGDLTRRTVLCNIDPRGERPEPRSFAFNALDRAKAERGPLVAAALTMVLAHKAAGAPRQAQPLGSFEGWSATVRDVLMWLGCADPLLTMDHIQDDDPEKAELDMVLAKWSEKVGTDRITVAQIIGRVSAYDHAAIKADLLSIAGARGLISYRRLGKWLGDRAKRRSQGRWLEQEGTLGGSGVWRLRAEA